MFKCQFELFREECTDNSYQSYLVVGVFSQEVVGTVVLRQSAPVVEIMSMFLFYIFTITALM